MPRRALLTLPLVACTGAAKDAGGVAPYCEPGATELPAACPCDAAAVEIGTGSATFEPLAEGSPLTMVHGPQGGWHMLGSGRFTNLLDVVTVHYTIEVAADGTLISDNTYRVQMLRDDECAGFYPGMYGYLGVDALADGERDTPPELLADTPLTLRMEVTDLDGRVATDTLGVLAALDPMDTPDSGAE